MQFKLAKLSLSIKIILFFFIIVILSGIGARIILEKAQERELQIQAEALANGIENILNFSSEVKSIWVENSLNYKVIDKLNVNHSENKMLLQRLHDPEFSKIISSYFQEKASITLEFSKQASQEWSTTSPIISHKKNILTYKKPIFATKSCVDCHSKLNQASYIKQGEIAGTLVITLQGIEFEKNFLQLISPINIISFILAIIALFGLIRFEIIKPLKFLSEKVREMSLGNLDVDLHVQNLNEDEVKDEILSLSIAIERLRKSQKALEKMVDDDSLKL